MVEVGQQEDKEGQQSMGVEEVVEDQQDIVVTMYKGREVSMEAEVVEEDKQLLLLNNTEEHGVDTFMETLPILPILTVQVEDMVAEMVEEVELVNMDTMVEIPEEVEEVAEVKTVVDLMEEMVGVGK